MNNLKRTAIAAGVAQFMLMASGAAMAQTAPAADAPPATVIVTGQRGALESAQKIKQNADEVVDSVVADDIGKLPDRSVTEVLQRVPGVTIDRTLNRSDPKQGVGDGVAHFAAEGTGVSIRGLSYVRSELNGRDSFSANGGRSLSFEDVPPELMAGVDVYKNPSAEQIEGGIGGLVNLRTALPFDFKGRKVALSTDVQGSTLRKKTSPPSLSGMYSDRWETDLGQIGVLIDLAHSKIVTQSDSMSVSPYYPRDNLVAGDNNLRWLSSGMSFSTNTFERTRDGLYGALQWKKGPVMSYLTYFRSKYKMHTGENSFSMANNPSTLTVDPGAIFDDKGALLTGTLRDDANHGIGIGSQSRSSGRDSDTRDLSWNTTWRVDDRWTVRADLQHVSASTEGYDNTIGLGGYTPSQTVDMRGSIPSFTFDQAARDYLADKNNYYWGFTQVHKDVATAKMDTARVDAKYSFDGPVLQDVRFGVRATERKALTQATRGNEWTQLSQSWAVGNQSWQPLAQFINLSDPRFGGDNHVQQFNNFFGGKGPSVPGIVAPNMSLTGSIPDITRLHTYFTTLCQEANATGRTNDCSWSLPPFGKDDGANEQRERTQAAYAQLRFAFDKAPYPIDGNVGVRVVRTNVESVGYTLFTAPTKPLVPGVPDIPSASSQQTYDNVYTKALPSLNLRMKVDDQLQFRLALSRGMSRPDFYQLQAYTQLSMETHTHNDPVTNTPVLDSIDYKGTLLGNPKLKPTMSNNIDLTAEYYFGPSSSLTLAVFNKRLKDIIIGQTTQYQLQDVTGKPIDFLATGPVNGASARVSGVELGYQQYFDKLPGAWSGLGVSGNFTYIDSSVKMNNPLKATWCTPAGTVTANLARDLQGCDTDGHVFGDLPMTGLSRTAYNLALLYDKGPLSMRVAYSWRDKYLQSSNAYGTADGSGIDRNPDSPRFNQAYSVNYGLPTWGGAYGQVDLGLQYKVTDNLRLGVQAGNVTNSVYKQYMQQGVGMKLRSAFYTGRSFGAQLNYTF